MAIEHDSTVLRHFRALYSGGTVAGLTDRQLLERFASRQDETRELAFAALVQRHGPMVLRVCRAALRDDHDAQDAFQAVFLVLVEKAGSLWVRDSLGPWLHGVALRVTARARASETRRRAHELKWAEEGTSSVPNQGNDDLGSVLHEEVGRLPERYRKAVLLCDLEGLTHEAAASQLGWPVGTVKSRQARGRERLRQRLARRGLAPTIWGSGMLSTRGMAPATVPAALVNSTIQAAIRIASSRSSAGVISASVAAMMKGGARNMPLISLRTAVAIVLAIGVSAGAGVLIRKRPWAGKPPEVHQTETRRSETGSTKEDVEKLQGTWVMIAQETNGGERPPDSNTKILIAGEMMIASYAEDDKSGEQARRNGTDIVSFKLDPSQVPKVMEVTPVAGPQKGKTRAGIYRIDGDTLQWCFNSSGGPRPKEFDTKPGLHERLIILRRAIPFMEAPATPAPNR